jgi:hypothetical protein
MRPRLVVATGFLAIACTTTEPAPRTVAQLAHCSPLVWLVDNVLALELPASGGWTVNQQPLDSAILLGQLHAIYEQRPASHRLLLVRATAPRRETEDLRWILMPLESLGVVVVQQPYHKTWTDSSGANHTDFPPDVHSPRVAGAMDSLKSGFISPEAAAGTIADELVATCSFIAEDTVRAVQSRVRAELKRRAGWQ